MSKPQLITKCPAGHPLTSSAMTTQFKCDVIFSKYRVMHLVYRGEQTLSERALNEVRLVR